MTAVAFASGLHYLHYNRNSGCTLKTYMSQAPAMKRSACCTRQKWVMRCLEGLLWNSKNSFAGNWISNDIKWKWSRESVPFLREPHFLWSRWDTKATREGSKGRAYGNKPHCVNEKKRRKKLFHCVLLNIMAGWYSPGCQICCSFTRTRTKEVLKVPSFFNTTVGVGGALLQ